ncbi:odorant receptor 94a-like [Teleopsis dalmanni]|uniref:odorant receptor 94a-like n=1 Tax=Teleopsis dalmanni TaxID=139649 RepID=UPI0018CF2963|nr:odorant receptor 94a-like [Teleopsis dalmanni]
MWLEAITSTDLSHTSDVLYITLTETALIVKVLAFKYYADEIAKILHTWQRSGIYALKTSEEILMWTRAQTIFGWITLIYVGGSLLMVSMQFISVFAEDSKELPFYYWVPFDWHSPRKYWYAYFYEVIAMPITCLSNTTLDMAFCYLMFHLSLCFRVVGLRLAQLGKNGNDNEGDFTEFKRVVVLHRNVKRYVKRCEDIVCYPILVQIIITAFVLCFTVYRLQNASIVENPGGFFSIIQYAFVMTMQIFLPCYYGNEISWNSQKLVKCLYQSNWKDLPQKHKRCVLIYMQYLQKPTVIRAGNFFLIGLPVFLKTINNAYSLCAVILNMEK